MNKNIYFRHYKDETYLLSLLGGLMKNKKRNKSEIPKKNPSFNNDQLGENASEEYASEEYMNVPKDNKGKKKNNNLNHQKQKHLN